MKHSAYIITVLAVVLIAVWLIAGTVNTAKKSEAGSLRIAEEAIKRASVTCYAIEGQYPSSLEYLIDNYNLVINTDKYIVYYNTLAPNLMPEITVFINDGGDALS